MILKRNQWHEKIKLLKKCPQNTRGDINVSQEHSARLFQAPRLLSSRFYYLRACIFKNRLYIYPNSTKVVQWTARRQPRLSLPNPSPFGAVHFQGYWWKDCPTPLQGQPIRSLQPANLGRKGEAKGVSSGQAKMASEWSRRANKLP